MSTHSLPTKLFTTPAAASAKQPSPCLTRFHKNKLKKMFSEMTFYIPQWLAWRPFDKEALHNVYDFTKVSDQQFRLKLFLSVFTTDRPKC